MNWQPTTAAPVDGALVKVRSTHDGWEGLGVKIAPAFAGEPRGEWKLKNVGEKEFTGRGAPDEWRPLTQEERDAEAAL